MERADIIADACARVVANDLAGARELILNEYPAPQSSTTRSKWTCPRLLRVFVRDCFTDRYFGTRLIFPGALRMLSLLLPEQFPYHRNWKQSETHPAFWELYPTVDHVIPVARGGKDDESNIDLDAKEWREGKLVAGRTRLARHACAYSQRPGRNAWLVCLAVQQQPCISRKSLSR